MMILIWKIIIKKIDKKDLEEENIEKMMIYEQILGYISIKKALNFEKSNIEKPNKKTKKI